MQSETFFEKTNEVFIAMQNFLQLPIVCQLEGYKPHGAIKKYPPMDAKTKNFLIDYFEPHNQELYKLLDIGKG
jgi:hypothetical protein